MKGLLSGIREFRRDAKAYRSLAIVLLPACLRRVGGTKASCSSERGFADAVGHVRLGFDGAMSAGVDRGYLFGDSRFCSSIEPS
ncbi:hypothetical protein GCM10028812_05320 [Ancylobacter sonchi]